MINLFMVSKNPKKPPQKSKSKSNQNKKSTRAQICFFMNLKGKKKLDMNSLYQMEPFEKNIVHFSDLNRC